MIVSPVSLSSFCFVWGGEWNPHSFCMKTAMFPSVSEDPKDELADPELDRIGSDIEEGGLDLSVPFQPITAYIGDKGEMLQQCFRVLGEKKLKKMLPDELKVV